MSLHIIQHVQLLSDVFLDPPVIDESPEGESHSTSQDEEGFSCIERKIPSVGARWPFLTWMCTSYTERCCRQDPRRDGELPSVGAGASSQKKVQTSSLSWVRDGRVRKNDFPSTRFYPTTVRTHHGQRWSQIGLSAPRWSMKSIVSNQPPVSFEADREHDQSQNGWIEPRKTSASRHLPRLLLKTLAWSTFHMTTQLYCNEVWVQFWDLISWKCVVRPGLGEPPRTNLTVLNLGNSGRARRPDHWSSDWFRALICWSDWSQQWGQLGADASCQPQTVLMKWTMLCFWHEKASRSCTSIFRDHMTAL